MVYAISGPCHVRPVQDLIIRVVLVPVKSANLADLLWCLNFEHTMFLEHIV